MFDLMYSRTRLHARLTGVLFWHSVCPHVLQDTTPCLPDRSSILAQCLPWPMSSPPSPSRSSTPWYLATSSTGCAALTQALLYSLNPNSNLFLTLTVPSLSPDRGPHPNSRACTLMVAHICLLLTVVRSCGVMCWHVLACGVMWCCVGSSPL